MERNKLVPKRRFYGFNDEWEECFVHEIAQNYYGGGTPKTSVKKFWQGTLPWIQSSDLSSEEVTITKPNHYITDEAIKKSATRKVPLNSIAIVTRVGVGKLVLLPFSYATSQDFLSLSNILINEYFAVYRLSKMLQKELNNIQGTSIKGMTKDDLLNKKITKPLSLEEQQKIGQFFKQLDEMIATQQRKVEKTKALKSAYLAEMFAVDGECVPKRRFAGFTVEWEERYLFDNIKSIIDFRGRTPKKLGLNWSETGYLALSALNVKNGYIDFKADVH